MSRAAVIDVGTNSTKLLVAENSPLDVLFEQSTVTRLGGGLVKTGRLQEQAIEFGAAVITQFVSEATERGAESILIVGTMGLRTATNARDFVDRVRHETGLTLEVIDGEEEARLSYKGASANLDVQGRVCVFDIGGGSTEIVVANGSSIESRRSVDVGARVATDDFLLSDPVTEGELQRLDEHLAEQLGDLDTSVEHVVGVGGTVTTLASVSLQLETYDRSRVHGRRLATREVRRLRDVFLSATVEERKLMRGLPQERADVVLAGASLVLAMAEGLQTEELIVSDWGLRHGLLMERFTEST